MHARTWERDLEPTKQMDVMKTSVLMVRGSRPRSLARDWMRSIVG